MLKYMLVEIPKKKEKLSKGVCEQEKQVTQNVTNLRVCAVIALFGAILKYFHDQAHCSSDISFRPQVFASIP